MAAKKESAADLATALAEACNRGDTAAAKKLVARGAKPDKTAAGWSGPPIFVAVNAGHEATARWLLGLGVKRPGDLLRTAAYSNQMWPPKFAWLVRELIEGGASVNRGDFQGTTAMHVLRDPELLELALQHRGNINIKDKDGSTPLHWAARTAPESYINLLLDKGADLNAKDRKGKTALDYAKAIGKYGKATVALLTARAGLKPAPPKRGSWKKVEDELVKRATAAIAAFAKKHRGETFGRFAFDCNSAYAEVLPSLQPAGAEPSWSIGDWKHQGIANIELDVDGIADAEEPEPFMAMACRALRRLDPAKAFAPLTRSPDFAVLAIDHDEDEATAVKRWKRVT